MRAPAPGWETLHLPFEALSRPLPRARPPHQRNSPHSPSGIASRAPGLSGRTGHRLLLGAAPTSIALNRQRLYALGVRRRRGSGRHASEPAEECQAWPRRAVLPCPTALPGRSAGMQAQGTAARGFQGPQSRWEQSGDHADGLLGRGARSATLMSLSGAAACCTAVDTAVDAPGSFA